eukprot:615967-Amorphochlora_amoeboformis.AAC.1
MQLIGEDWVCSWFNWIVVCQAAEVDKSFVHPEDIKQLVTQGYTIVPPIMQAIMPPHKMRYSASNNELDNSHRGKGVRHALEMLSAVKAELVRFLKSDVNAHDLRACIRFRTNLAQQRTETLAFITNAINKSTRP